MINKCMVRQLDIDTLIMRNGIFTHPFIEVKKTFSVRMTNQKRRNFVNLHLNKSKLKFSRLFKVWQDTVNFKRIKQAMNDNHIDYEWMSELEMLTKQFIEAEFKPYLAARVTESGTAMAKLIDRELNKKFNMSMVEVKQFNFNGASSRTIDYINNQAFHLITWVSQGIIEIYRNTFSFMKDNNFSIQNAQSLLRDVTPLQVTGPYNYNRVLNYHQALVTEGVLTPKQIASKVKVRALKMKQLRVELIARTELSRAYNFGNQETIRQAQDAGLVSKPKKKRIVVMDGNEQHGDMNGEIREMDEAYSNGEMYPGESSYNCRCVEEYILDDTMEAAA